MAIEITVAELAAANRIGSTTKETTEVTRIRDYAVVAISQHLTVAVYDVAPVPVLDMATSLLLGYLYDKPTVSGGVSLANALKFSGAARVLFPYRLHSVGMVGGDAVVAAQAAVGTVGNPVTDVDIVGTELRITFSDGTTEMLDLPAAGGGTVDQTARDSAASAQTAADAAQTDVDEHEANHPSGGTGVDQTARATASNAATAAGNAQGTADANATAIALRLQRGDVSPGTGIAIVPTEGSTTGLTISAVETTSGPTVLTGAWSWITFSPNAGEVMPSDTVVPPAIDTWIFNTTGATYDDDRAALLALASGATILFYQSDDRQQTVTLTETPTLSGSTVTVTGSGSRTGGFGELGPANFGTLTITLTPAPSGGMGGVDQDARDAAMQAAAAAVAAQGTADGAQTTADGAATAAAGAQGTADGAATSAGAAQATANTGIANAANAQSTADGAATSAGTAQGTAAAAQTTANAAQTTADGKIDADAATALITEHARQHFAHHTPPHIGSGGGILPVLNGRLPGPPIAMQFGWNQSQTHTQAVFNRANDHPIDGAAVGMSDGLALPPFPPSLSTDVTLYLHLWVEGTPDVAAIRSNADTNPADVTAMFPGSLSGSLTVGGVAGTVYVSNVRLASMEGVVYDVLIAGAEIATVTDTTRYAATFGLLTDLAAGTWANYTSGLDAGEISKHGAFAVVTAAGRDKLMIPTTGVYSIKAMVAGIIDLGGSTDRGWLETRLVRTRAGVEVAQAPVGVLGYARNQLGTAAQTLNSAVDGYYELQANDQIHLEAMLASQDVDNLLDLTSGYLGLVKF